MNTRCLYSVVFGLIFTLSFSSSTLANQFSGRGDPFEGICKCADKKLMKDFSSAWGGKKFTFSNEHGTPELCETWKKACQVSCGGATNVSSYQCKKDSKWWGGGTPIPVEGYEVSGAPSKAAVNNVGDWTIGVPVPVPANLEFDHTDIERFVPAYCPGLPYTFGAKAVAIAYEKSCELYDESCEIWNRASTGQKVVVGVVLSALAIVKVGELCFPAAEAEPFSAQAATALCALVVGTAAVAPTASAEAKDLGTACTTIESGERICIEGMKGDSLSGTVTFPEGDTVSFQKSGDSVVAKSGSHTVCKGDLKTQKVTCDQP